MTPVRIATRGSPLALAQAGTIARAVGAALGRNIPLISSDMGMFELCWKVVSGRVA